MEKTPPESVGKTSEHSPPHESIPLGASAHVMTWHDSTIKDSTDLSRRPPGRVSRSSLFDRIRDYPASHSGENSEHGFLKNRDPVHRLRKPLKGHKRQPASPVKLLLCHRLSPLPLNSRPDTAALYARPVEQGTARFPPRKPERSRLHRCIQGCYAAQLSSPNNTARGRLTFRR